MLENVCGFDFVGECISDELSDETEVTAIVLRCAVTAAAAELAPAIDKGSVREAAVGEPTTEERGSDTTAAQCGICECIAGERETAGEVECIRS